MGRVIAIDGPSGAGKSTLARQVAEAAGFAYLDTGALYRATALGLVRAGLVQESTDDEIAKALKGLIVEFAGGRAVLNGEDVSDAIRTTEAGRYSSIFSARRPVRDFLMPVQQRAAEHADLVAEGRDMGTVVFPRAWRKFYLVASVEARAQRRFSQLADTPNAVSMQDAMRDVVERDERDSSRDIAPLAKAPDAVEIDSSNLTVREVFDSIMNEVRK